MKELNAKTHHYQKYNITNLAFEFLKKLECQDQGSGNDAPLRIIPILLGWGLSIETPIPILMNAMEIVRMISFFDIKKNPFKVILYFFIVSIMLLCLNENVMAATVDQSIIEKIITKYSDLGTTWGDNVKSHSIWLLKVMITIQLIWMALKLGLKQATLQSLIEEFVIVIFFGSVFFLPDSIQSSIFR